VPAKVLYLSQSKAQAHVDPALFDRRPTLQDVAVHLDSLDEILAGQQLLSPDAGFGTYTVSSCIVDLLEGLCICSRLQPFVPFAVQGRLSGYHSG